MGEKAVWDKANVKHFCDICREEVLAGHRPLGHLNKVGWKNLEDKSRRLRAPQGKYEIFNFLHSSLRNVIERAFGVLKQKWRILKAMPSFSPRRQKHIIIACMALHNFIRDSKLRDEEFDKCDEDEDYMPEAAQAATQPQGDDDPEEENEATMNTIRDRIANALFLARAS